MMMTTWIQIAVLAAPFALVGGLVSWAIVAIGNGTRPRATSPGHVATPAAQQPVPPITAATAVFSGYVSHGR
jgi:hypothetical protein